jgi:hypothetical protein
MMVMDNNSQIRLMLNSDQAKEIKKWLLADMLFDFRLLGWSISVWVAWPFLLIRHIGNG